VRLAATAFALVLPAAMAQAGSPLEPTPPQRIEIVDDGTPVHRPSGLRLPRSVRGPVHTHNAVIIEISPCRSRVQYGPVTVTIFGRHDAQCPEESDALAPIPPAGGWKADADPPALPALLFRGESAEPEIRSFISPELPEGSQWWLSATVTSQDFDARADGLRLEMQALYGPEHRDTVVRAMEAVWATLAAANPNPAR